MNKEEYAIFHYLLAKLKYDLCEEAPHIGNDETYLKYKQAIENIDNIMSFLFIEGDEKE